ncbi:MAG: branched-chain amino acid ABC transporter permease, partial [Bacteroidia bacterium]
MTGKHHFKKWGNSILLLGLLSLPWLLSSSSLRLVELMLILSIAGMGLQLLTGQAGLISLGQAGFMAIGAYTTSFILSKGYPLGVGVLAAVSLAAVGGLLLGLPANRLKGPYLAIVSLAFGIGISTWIAHTEWLGASSGMSVVIPDLSMGFISQEYSLYGFILIVAITIYMISRVLRSSAWGLIWLGLRDQEVMVAHLGINPARYKSLAFAICAAFGGLSGSLWAMYVGYLSPTSFGFTLSISLLAGIVFGGMYSLQGAIIGVCLLTFLEQNLLP